jgi:uncharacterized membrane protein (DUF485 family)
VTPTRPSTLLAAGVVGSALGYAVTSLLDSLGYGLPRVSWVGIGLLLFLAVLLLVASRRVRAWISGDRPQAPGDALTMGRLVALAMASSVFGAVMTGVYLGMAAVGLDRLSTEYGREHVLWSLGGAAACIAVLAAALILERACRLPGDGDHGTEPG